MREVIAATSPRIQTTVGDLVEAITQIALQAGRNEAEGYVLARLAIESVLQKNHIKHIKTSGN